MRHEKISLVVLAYIIGFTTAYIAFALNEDRAYTPSEVINAVGDQARTVNPASTRTHQSNVQMDQLGLLMTVDGEQKVISGKLQEGVDPGPGFHVEVPAYSISPSGDYVYYCEQQTAGTDECHPYVYSVAEHVTRPLRVDDRQVTLPLNEANLQWRAAGTLWYQEYRSDSPERPWALALAR